MPERIQRQRTKGWKMPPNTVYVGRPGPWGNPFNFAASDHCWTALAFGCRGDAKGRREASVKAFREWIAPERGRIKEWEFGVVMEGQGRKIEIGPRTHAGEAPSLDAIRAQLQGKNLACWCPLDQPCHADVLLELANAARPKTGSEGNE
jgi:hypothetical protein